MMIGYARVSTDEQNPALQFDALDRAGCDRIFVDYASGSAANRPALDEALALLRTGDTLVAWMLDRLGRSLSHLIELVMRLEKEGISFRSVSEAIDTRSAGGRLLFHVMGALAEFERALISERTRAGMAAAKARGVSVGRPKKLSSKDIASAIKMLSLPQSTVTEVASWFSVSTSTFSRALGRNGLLRRI